MNLNNVIEAKNVSKIFVQSGKDDVVALKNINFTAEKGKINILVGPDSSGKTTFLRLCAGLLNITSGDIFILNKDIKADKQFIQSNISYMPQKFGLYEDLTVHENITLYAKLFGIKGEAKEQKYKQLLEITDLTRFKDRLAGNLSGGMKQKLGLACTMISNPKVLLLDEPCVGVDPLSRRDLWKIIKDLAKTSECSIIVSTAYIDECEHADKVTIFHEGEIIANMTSDDLKNVAKGKTYTVKISKEFNQREVQAFLIEQHQQIIDAIPLSGNINITIMEGKTIEKVIEEIPLLKKFTIEERPSSYEDGFMQIFRNKKSKYAEFKDKIQLNEQTTQNENANTTPIIDIKDLVKKFDKFTAVNHTSFNVSKGEIFGLLGPNGAGKTTTFKILCGLIPATSGCATVAGYDLFTSRDIARKKIGYVAQKFSLYGDLSVLENLKFFGGIYGIPKKQLKFRIEEVINDYELYDVLNDKSGELPGGYKQRLSMAVGTIHKPEILFLDEPTSGIDPLTRRMFWHKISLIAQNGTTIIITTHFLEESEYCNKIMIQDGGQMIAFGTPKEVRQQGGESENSPLTMEQVFINIVEQSRGDSK